MQNQKNQSSFNWRRSALATLSGLLLGHNLHAETCRAWQDSDAGRTGLRVGTVSIENQDIFDPDNPKENRWYNKMANRLHLNTRAEVVGHYLLFRSGDPYDPGRLAESERLLRAQGYIKDARITPRQVCGQQVNLQVYTTDNWTLAPGMGVGRSGGQTKARVELEEHNLLGWGKSLSIGYQHGSERNQTHLAYRDPHFLGSHRELTLATQNNSDGQGYELGLQLPFYAFHSREAWGMQAKVLKQEKSFYQQGEVTRKIGDDLHNAQLFYGWSAGKQGDHTQRYLVGWQYEKKAWFPTGTTPDTPPDSVQSYPWVGYEYAQDDYAARENFRTMGKTEDIELGHRLSVRAGLPSKGLGADANYLKLGTHYSKGFSPGNKQLALLEWEADTWLGNGRLEGVRGKLKLEWNRFNGAHSSWHVGGEFNVANNLLPGEQILLGGDNGLRGYPTGYQTGDKSLVLSAEKRFYFNWYPMQVARVGAVVFADAGTAWGNGQPAEWLGDVGVGLRVVSTRSSTGRVLHLDVAMPLNPENKDDKYQVLVGTETSF